MDEYLKWICGFANAQGGCIYIGVDDEGRVVGVQNGKRFLEEIPNKIQTNLGFLVNIIFGVAARNKFCGVQL